MEGMNTDTTTGQSQRKPRADKGPRLYERDTKALAWIAQQYVIGLDHLAILLARLTEPGAYTQTPKQQDRLTQERATEVVRRWEEMGLAERKWILHGQPPVICLTNEGLRLVANELGELRSYSPSAATLNHLNSINHARLFIEKRRQDAQWFSERLIRANQGKTEPGVKRPHIPDGIVVSNGRTMAIEVELSTKTSTRLSKILHELSRNNQYYTVWYFCRGRAINVVSNTIAGMHEMYRNKFAVYDIDQQSL
jgi:hypothetical protein